MASQAGKKEMLTTIAFILFVIVGWMAIRQQQKDSTDIGQLVREIRQDLRLIVYLLAAILLMIAISADYLGH